MLSEDEKFVLEKNEKMLAVPKAKFIFVYGSLAFGGIAATLVLGVTKLIGGNISLPNAVLTFMAFMGAGAGYAFLMRQGIEKNRDSLLKKMKK